MPAIVAKRQATTLGSAAINVSHGGQVPTWRKWPVTSFARTDLVAAEKLRLVGVPLSSVASQSIAPYGYLEPLQRPVLVGNMIILPAYLALP
jgi:hypothetical protein